MSTTFSVYPLKKAIPTFQEVLNLSTEKLNRFLKDVQINFSVKIEVKLIAKENDIEHQIDLSSPAKWEDDFYAWFTVSSINGGVDSYYWELSDEDKLDNLEEILNKPLESNRKDLVKNCLENKVEWHFRKSAGQNYITAVTFGFIASSFAELTEGIIFSNDCAWDYQIFPATAGEFDKCYLRPEKALSEVKKSEAINFIKDLSFELKIL